MHFFAGIGSLFIFCGILLLAARTTGHFFQIFRIPQLSCVVASGFCIVTGILLAALGLLGELLVAVLTRIGKE